jgi:hypothetical protein
MGYTVQLDAQPPVDAGLPASVTCKDFVGGKTATGVPFSVSVVALGVHTVTVTGYAIGTTTPPATVTFPLGPAPSKPTNVRITK